MVDLGNNVVVYVDYAEHRLVMIDLWEEVIVYVEYAERRLVMIDLEENVIVHVDYAEHRLVMTDLGEDVIIHVDWAEHSFGRDWPWTKRHRSRGLGRPSSDQQPKTSNHKSFEYFRR